MKERTMKKIRIYYMNSWKTYYYIGLLREFSKWLKRDAHSQVYIGLLREFSKSLKRDAHSQV